MLLTSVAAVFRKKPIPYEKDKIADIRMVVSQRLLCTYMDMETFTHKVAPVLTAEHKRLLASFVTPGGYGNLYLMIPLLDGAAPMPRMSYNIVNRLRLGIPLHRDNEWMLRGTEGRCPVCRMEAVFNIDPISHFDSCRGVNAERRNTRKHQDTERLVCTSGMEPADIPYDREVALPRQDGEGVALIPDIIAHPAGRDKGMLIDVKHVSVGCKAHCKDYDLGETLTNAVAKKYKDIAKDQALDVRAFVVECTGALPWSSRHVLSAIRDAADLRDPGTGAELVRDLVRALQASLFRHMAAAHKEYMHRARIVQSRRRDDLDGDLGLAPGAVEHTFSPQRRGPIASSRYSTAGGRNAE